MKVLYFIHQLCIGGAETIVTNYLIALKNRGVEVVLVEADASNTFLDERLREEDIRIWSLYPACDNSLFGRLRRKLIRKTLNIKKRWNYIIQQEKPDIIHTHTSVTLLNGIDFPMNRIVCSIHTDVERNISVVGEKNHIMLKHLAENGAWFFSLNDKMTTDIQQYYKTTRIVYIPNGIDFEKIRANRYDRESFFREIGIPSNSFIVGHVGRFHYVKNHARLIEIFAEVRKKQSNAYLLLVGTGNDEELQTVTNQISKCNLEDYVIMLGVRNDATAIMSVFDTFVLPSTSESFSLVLVEAQVQGVRCVASDVVPDAVICNADCHRLSLECTNEEWADIILSDSKQSGTNSIETFDMRNVIERMCVEYQRIIIGE